MTRHIEKLPEFANFVTIDVSLISLRDILSHARRLATSNASVVALFKPQYETRDPSLLVHGIVRDEVTRQELFNDFLEWLGTHQWKVEKWIESPIRGREGNKEYLFYLKTVL
jgi:23S rRNA (cytidine1920-2'-O)/16S rRNA (cytidine1409-2'-O)-methyltransferase